MLFFQVASKNCATFSKCIRKIDGTIKDNQKLSKFYIKGFERPVYWNEYKTKSEKNTINNCRYFLESNFAGVNRLLVFYLSKHSK